MAYITSMLGCSAELAKQALMQSNNDVDLAVNNLLDKKKDEDQLQAVLKQLEEAEEQKKVTSEIKQKLEEQVLNCEAPQKPPAEQN